MLSATLRVRKESLLADTSSFVQKRIAKNRIKRRIFKDTPFCLKLFENRNHPPSPAPLNRKCMRKRFFSMAVQGLLCRLLQLYFGLPEIIPRYQKTRLTPGHAQGGKVPVFFQPQQSVLKSVGRGRKIIIRQTISVRDLHLLIIVFVHSLLFVIQLFNNSSTALAAI